MTNGFADTTADPSKTYSYKLFSYNKAGKPNNYTENEFLEVDFWGSIHAMSQNGTLLDVVSIGDIFTFNHTDYGEIPIRLVDYNATTPGVTPTISGGKAAVFECIDCIDQLSFHTQDLQYDLTMDATFVSGKKYYTKSGNTYSQATVTTGNPIPANTYYELNSSRTGYESGNSKWCESNVMKWLNAETQTDWFTRSYCGDNCSYANKNGFFYGIEKSLKKWIISVDRREHTNNAWGGKYYTTACKIFLPFCYEIDASNKSEEAVRRWNWYSSNPAQTNRIKKVNGTANYWWTATAPQTRTSPVYTFASNGANNNNQNAKAACGVAPCFCL